MTTDRRDGQLAGVRGAVYVPARAFNGYQAWRGYDPAEIERDLGYAALLNLSALRVFLSYEYWCENRDAHERSLDHFLTVAAEHDIRLVPILFESAGKEPTRRNLSDEDPITGCAVRSPSGTVIRNEWRPRDVRGPYGMGRTVRSRLRHGHRWEETSAFVDWIMERYGDDERLLAVEIMNEPGGWDKREDFARAMLQAAAEHGGSVSLTMGCKSLVNNRLFEDPPLDVFQFHHNLPPTATDMAEQLDEALALADAADTPVWLTEWQRTREEPPDVMLPNYASLTETIRESDVHGDFFWSLMLKPAYLPKPRKWGRLNGVFHEDGTVFSRDDARTIAGDAGLRADERRAWPEWAETIAEAVDAPRPE